MWADCYFSICTLLFRSGRLYIQRMVQSRRFQTLCSSRGIRLCFQMQLHVFMKFSYNSRIWKALFNFRTLIKIKSTFCSFSKVKIYKMYYLYIWSKFQRPSMWKSQYFNGMKVYNLYNLPLKPLHAADKKLFYGLDDHARHYFQLLQLFTWWIYYCLYVSFYYRIMFALTQFLFLIFRVQ